MNTTNAALFAAVSALTCAAGCAGDDTSPATMQAFAAVDEEAGTTSLWVSRDAADDRGAP